MAHTFRIVRKENKRTRTTTFTLLGVEYATFLEARRALTELRKHIVSARNGRIIKTYSLESYSVAREEN